MQAVQEVGIAASRNIITLKMDFASVSEASVSETT